MSPAYDTYDYLSYWEKREYEHESEVIALSAFLKKIAKTENGCWNWTGPKTNGGYGHTRGVGENLTHSVFYRLIVGDVPDGLDLDHLCRNPSCVNPSHLEAVTHRENCARGIARLVNGDNQRRKTHCPQGHLYDLFNTYWYKSERHCRICTNQHNAEYRARKKCGLHQ